MPLVAVTVTPGTAAYGAAYRDGAWGPVTPIAQSASLAHGGGGAARKSREGRVVEADVHGVRALVAGRIRYP